MSDEESTDEEGIDVLGPDGDPTTDGGEPAVDLDDVDLEELDLDNVDPEELDLDNVDPEELDETLVEVIARFAAFDREQHSKIYKQLEER